MKPLTARKRFTVAIERCQREAAIAPLTRRLERAGNCPSRFSLSGCRIPSDGLLSRSVSSAEIAGQSENVTDYPKSEVASAPQEGFDNRRLFYIPEGKKEVAAHAQPRPPSPASA